MLGLLTITVVVFGLTTAVATDEYDHVIIGSGPGGGSLASVLTSYTQTKSILMKNSANLAIEGYSVFLIEAGGDSSDSLHQAMPAMQVLAVFYVRTLHERD
jgi:choline dehydrogenase